MTRSINYAIVHVSVGVGVLMGVVEGRFRCMKGSPVQFSKPMSDIVCGVHRSADRSIAEAAVLKDTAIDCT